MPLKLKAIIHICDKESKPYIWAAGTNMFDNYAWNTTANAFSFKMINELICHFYFSLVAQNMNVYAATHRLALCRNFYINT